MKKTNKEFINKAQKIHGNKYDYSLTEYINARTKVKIICPEHGIFEQNASSHIRGRGCIKCSGILRHDKIYFYSMAKMVHGERYDYSLVEYKNQNSLIKIICPEHGIFEQKPVNHLLNKQGCSKCSGNKKLTTEEFIEKAKKIHGNRYDYSLVEYSGAKNKIRIICSEHGIFEQIATNHIGKGNESGCPMCNESKGEKLIKNIFINKNINFISQYRFLDCKNKRPLPFDLYLPEYNICIEYDGIQHFIPRWGGIDALNIIKKNDAIKTKYCLDNNIKLYRIKYNENIQEKFKIILKELKNE